MDRFSPSSTSRADDGVAPTTPLFLALYLLVLAFFIVLVSISSIEDVKTRAVMDSLNSTFASILPPSSELTTFASQDGDFIAGQAFQEQVGEIFATQIQVMKTKVLQPGRIMEVVVDTDSLFAEGSEEILPGRLPLIDRVIAALSARTPGLDYALEFILGTRPDADDLMTARGTLESRRVGVFARTVLERGAPPASIAVAIEPGRPQVARLRFYSRPVEEMRFDFTPPETGRPGAPAGGG